MKLHKDGTLEGTPQEIAEYNRLTEQNKKPDWPNSPMFKEWRKSPGIGLPNPLLPSITCVDDRGTTTVQSDYWNNVQAWNGPGTRVIKGNVTQGKIIDATIRYEGYEEHQLNFDE